MSVNQNSDGKWQCGSVTMKKGDILLGRATTGVNSYAIPFGQKLMGWSSKASTIHAGIYVGDGMVSQSHGVGLTTDQLNGTDPWKVYRLKIEREIPELAAEFAKIFVIRFDGAKNYSRFRAIKSLFKGRSAARSQEDVKNYIERLDGNGSLRHRTFYCSNFVTICYSLASEMLTNNPHFCIPIDYERVSPAEMAEFFEEDDRHWSRKGEITG
jgi:hypothetical protein